MKPKGSLIKCIKCKEFKIDAAFNKTFSRSNLKKTCKKCEHKLSKINSGEIFKGEVKK